MLFGTGVMAWLSVVFFHRPGAPPLGGVSIQQSHLSAIKLVVFKTSTLNKSLPHLQWTGVRVWLSCDFIESSILTMCLSVLVIQLVITLPLQYLQQYLPSLGRQSSCSHAVWLHSLPLCTPPACLPVLASGTHLVQYVMDSPRIGTLPDPLDCPPSMSFHACKE